MSAYDEESPLDSFLEMEKEEPDVRGWLIGLISIMGLAVFVGVAWYVYQSKLDTTPDLSVPVNFASAAPVAAMQTEPDAVAASRQVSPADAAMAAAEPAIDVTVSVEDGTVTISADAGSATVTADTGTVIAAEMVPPTADLALAPSETGIAGPSQRPTAIPVETRAAGPVEERAMVIDPAALLTNRDQVDDLSVTSLVQPKHGRLVANGDGTFTYEPDAGYTGTDSFSYTVTVFRALGTASAEPTPVRISAPSALPEPSDSTPVQVPGDVEPPANIRLAANLTAATRLIDADTFERVNAALADPSPSTEASPASKQFAAQFAAFRSAASAERAWAALQRKYPDILAETAYHVQTIDLGSDKGVFHRLQAIGFATRSAAVDICQRLQARQQVCFVIPR